MSGSAGTLPSPAASWTANLLSLFGILLMVGAIGYSIATLRDVRAQIATATDAVASATREAEVLEREVARTGDEVERIRSGPLSDLIVPKAIAVRRDGLKDAEGRQLYNFIVWLDLPYARRSDIRSVEYTFGDPSFLRNRQTSREPSNGFAVGYLGWGAMSSVPITVVPSQGEAFTLHFPMLSQLTLVGEQVP